MRTYIQMPTQSCKILESASKLVYINAVSEVLCACPAPKAKVDNAHNIGVLLK